MKDGMLLFSYGYSGMAGSLQVFIRKPTLWFGALGAARTAPGRVGVGESHPGLASASNVADRRCPDRCGGESKDAIGKAEFVRSLDPKSSKEQMWNERELGQQWKKNNWSEAWQIERAAEASRPKQEPGLERDSGPSR